MFESLKHQLTVALLIALTGCVNSSGLPLETGRHLTAPAPISSASIPKPVAILPPLPKPQAPAPADTYSLVVNHLPVNELLFALARDAKVNLDIHPAVSGHITVNAIDQTLPQIMERIARQVDIRWTLEHNVLSVQPDTAFNQTYTLDYLNIARASAAYTRVKAAVANGSDEYSSSVYGGFVDNQFWERLERGLCDLVLSGRRNAQTMQQHLADREKQREIDKLAAQSGRNKAQLEQELAGTTREQRLDVAKQLSAAHAGAPQLYDRVLSSSKHRQLSTAKLRRLFQETANSEIRLRQRQYRWQRH